MKGKESGGKGPGLERRWQRKGRLRAVDCCRIQYVNQQTVTIDTYHT